MKNKSTEGILFPQNIQIEDLPSSTCELPKLLVVPRKSWNYVGHELIEAFKDVLGCKPTNIFVFSFLRNGKIGFDDSFSIYTDSDCDLSDEILVKNDDVCSEEFGAEVLLPIFDAYYPNAKVNQFLTPEKNEKNLLFFRKLVKAYPKALFIISRNETEDSVWPENLQD